MFLHHVLNQKTDSLVFRFFMAQMNSPTHKYWGSTVLDDLEELEMHIEIGDIRSMTKEKFKRIVKEKVTSKAFQYLIKKKADRISENAKGKLLIYTDLEKSEYLTPIESELSIQDKKWLFKSRLEDIDIPQKWNNENIICKHCPTIELNQKHLFECPYLIGKNKILTYIPKYEDIFIGDIEEQIYASKILKENFRVMQADTTM